MSITTVEGGYFKNTDITHKPKRYQDEVANESPSITSVGGGVEDTPLSGIPQSVTLESAIEWYTTHAEGPYKNLYTRTAIWLKHVRALENNKRTHGRVRDIVSEVESEVKEEAK